MESPKIKFGVLGCSRVAQKGVIPGIIDSEGAELYMIAGRESDEVSKFAGEFNCSNVGSYEDVLKSKEVDVIYVSLPNALHEEWTLKAI